MRKYEAVAVLCGGLHWDGRTYRPATYEQADEFGMLGGHIRVAAAVGMQLMGECSEFLFSGGVSEKLKTTHGPDVPAEAGVYRNMFYRGIETYAADHPVMYRFLPGAKAPSYALLGLKANNTATNVQETIDTAVINGWGEVALLTNSYHISRAQAWSEEMSRLNQETKGLPQLEVISAEEVVLRVFPGVYDEAIDTAYRSEAGILRLKNEEQGFRDIQRGQIVVDEFQVHQAGLV